jgi:geranylgeranyl reductase family protein
LIVVGAGPAGSSAARKGAQVGLKTLLIEKERLPRNKLCGGGVTPKVLKLLDFKVPDEIIEYAPKSIRIHVSQTCYDFHSTQPLVYMTSRSKFDTFLTEKAEDAGVEVRDRVPVQRIATHPSYCEIDTRNETFKARMVIGADGMGGPTARTSHLYETWTPTQVAYAIESEVPVGEEAVSDFIGDEEYFDIYFGISPAGYGWVFPKDDHLTVGVGCRLSNLRDAQGLFRGFLKAIPQLEGRDVPRPQAHLIPLGGVARVPLAAERVLLAGDSGGFAEPLLGEGIYFAILGGQIAAEVAEQACREDRFGSQFLGSYARRCQIKFGTDFDFAFQLASASYLETYDMDRIGRFFFSDKRFHACMAGLMDGTVRYRDLQRKLVWPYLKYRLDKLGLRYRH